MEVKVEVNVSLVMAALERLAAGVEGRKDFRVAYGGGEVDYALAVHERTDLYHAPPARAQWLLNAAREGADAMRAAVRREAEIGAIRGRPLDGLNAGLRRASEYLLEKANETVPVDTGALKASGRVEEGAAQ